VKIYEYFLHRKKETKGVDELAMAALAPLSRSAWWFRIKAGKSSPSSPPTTTYSFTRSIAALGVNTQAFTILVPYLVPPKNYQAKFVSIQATAIPGTPGPTVSKITFWFYDSSKWIAVTSPTDCSAVTVSNPVTMPILPAMVSYIINYIQGADIYVSVTKDVVEGNAGASPGLTWNWTLQYL
jgi:hypothetical protein